ncbi:MAG TPA: hypothetical protein VK816_04010 [Jatrophihabitantaceae bacterium]|jgi:hypothetical protein|nr:hypothetical protein [Jatrophihabitantaceae bacterium]
MSALQLLSAVPLAVIQAAASTAAAATPSPTPTPVQGGEDQKSGPLGLVVILVLCIGCYYLFKSMSKHMRKIRDDFPILLPDDPLHPVVDHATAAGHAAEQHAVEAAGVDGTAKPRPGSARSGETDPLRAPDQPRRPSHPA